MAIERMIGKIVLSGSIRKKLSQAAYREYSQAAREIEQSGLLRGVEAELKLKAKKGFLGKKSQDYVQLAYQDANGKAHKLKLSGRSEKMNVKQYLENAVRHAKKVNVDAVKSGMAKSKNYLHYNGALNRSQQALQNLPEEADVSFKRNFLTGRKKARIEVPVEQNGRTVVLKQTLQKEKGKDIKQFVRNSFEHANLTFENAINPRGQFSVRQIENQIQQSKERKVNHALHGLKKEWQTPLEEARYFQNETPTSRETAQAAADQASRRLETTWQKIQHRVERQRAYFQTPANHVDEFNAFQAHLAASPSRGKGRVNLEQAKRNAVAAYEARQQVFNEAQGNLFTQRIDRGMEQFHTAQAASAPAGRQRRVRFQEPIDATATPAVGQGSQRRARRQQTAQRQTPSATNAFQANMREWQQNTWLNYLPNWATGANTRATAGAARNSQPANQPASWTDAFQNFAGGIRSYFARPTAAGNTQATARAAEQAGQGAARTAQVPPHSAGASEGRNLFEVQGCYTEMPPSTPVAAVTPPRPSWMDRPNLFEVQGCQV